MILKELKVCNFRNYLNLNLSFPNTGALFFGENGTGKTNILEAIYFLYTGRSHRGALRRDIVTSGQSESLVEGIIQKSSYDPQISLTIGFSRDKTTILKKNNQKVQLLSDILNHSNIISFGPYDTLLIFGDPSERRKFIDVSLSQTDQSYLSALIFYRKYLLQRNKTLSSRGNSTLLDIYEEKLAEYGSTIYIKRIGFFNFISPLFLDYFKVIDQKRSIASVFYKSSVRGDFSDLDSYKSRFVSLLRESRAKDSIIGTTSLGVHRDDIQLFINDRLSRLYGSLGQCRMITIALRLSFLAYLENQDRKPIVLLIDDAFNELDNVRRDIVYSLISNKGQLFVTSLSYKDNFLSFLPRLCVNKNTILPL